MAGLSSEDILNLFYPGSVELLESSTGNGGFADDYYHEGRNSLMYKDSRHTYWRSTMKGIIFSEFLEMVDDKFSIEMSERLIDEVKPASGGAYTTVGTYNAQEIVDMVLKLSEITSIPVPDLLETFGRHLLGRFVLLFPQFFEGVTSAFEFLPMVENYVHLEVKKLYSDAELPSFKCESSRPGRLEMTYHSGTNLPDLAEGLILGVADHFNERVEVKREKIPEDPSAELFIITKLQN